MKSSLLRIVLAFVIIILGYLVFISINEPLKFQEELQRRNEVVIDKLNDIRNSEILFKQVNNHYTGSFDTLIAFIKNGKIPIVKMVNNPKDTNNSRSDNYSIWYVSIADSVFGKRKDYRIEDIAKIPFSAGAEFLLEAGRIEKYGVSIAVFEAAAPYEVYLNGIDNDLIKHMVRGFKAKKKFPGLKVGSMTDVSTVGNWE